jgi:iron complex transport system substrate-binding protein
MMPRRFGLILLVLAAGLMSIPAATWAVAGPDPETGAIVDAAGRRVPTNRPFQRIISLYGAHTENLFSLGAGDRVIGVTRNDDWPSEAKTKPVFSYHDDLEKFLAARPDLVLIRPMIDRGYARLISGLETHGITVVSLQPTTLAQMYGYWEILGRFTGRQAAAVQMTDRFQQTIARIGRITGAIARKKRVYFEAIHHRMRTFAPSAMPIFVLETAGGVNVARDAVARRGTNIADFGKERILSHADEIDVYIAQYGPMNHPTLEIISSEPGYHLIKAVRSQRVYLIDEKLVSRPTMRMLDGICRMAGILYPQMFSDGAFSSACPLSAGIITGDRIQKEVKP